MDSLENLLNSVREIVKTDREQREERWKGSEPYNILEVLKMGEESHSNMLKDLLNPSGDHGLGDRFLKAFLESVDCLTGLGFDTKYATVERKKSIAIENGNNQQKGRIDILITSGNKAIVIENKIYNSDQPDQLLKYRNYAEEKFKGGYKLLYLTRDASEASYKSTDGKLQEGEDYFRISYNNEILKWLVKCEGMATSPLRQYISKYISLIKEITFQTMEPVNKEKFLEELVKDENIGDMDSIASVINLREEWKERVMEKYLYSRLREYAKSKGLNFELGPTPSFYFYRKEWDPAAIYFIIDDDIDNPQKREKVYDKDRGIKNYCMYCTLTYRSNCREEEKQPLKDIKDECRGRIEKEGWELGSEEEKAFSPIGWKYLDKRYATMNYAAMRYVVDGTVEKEVKELVETVLAVIKERNLLPLPPTND